MRNWPSVPFCYRKRGFYCVEDNMNIFDYWPLKYISEGEFIIKSVPVEDTIDSIEELDIDFLNGLDGFTLTEIERFCMEKQNEIIRKVNQLDKQIKELKK